MTARSVVAASVIVLCATSSARAQTRSAADSVHACAARLLEPAGFRVALKQAALTAWVRARDDGAGATYPVDALRVRFAVSDSVPSGRVEVSGKTLLMSRRSGLGAGESAATRELLVLADSVTRLCDRPRPLRK